VLKNLLRDLLGSPVSHYNVWSVISAHNLTSVMSDDW